MRVLKRKKKCQSQVGKGWTLLMDIYTNSYFFSLMSLRRGEGEPHTFRRFQAHREGILMVRVENS